MARPTAPPTPTTAGTQASRDLAQQLAGPLPTGDHVRPLLAMVARISGLECAYLTRVDPAQTRQWVVVSHCTHHDGTVVAEGAADAWDDSLCRRALAQGVSYTTTAEDLYPPGAAGRAAGMGIHTYMGQPIRDHDGTLLGTLCAVSRERVPMRDGAATTLALFAQLLGLQVEHDRAVEAARAAFEDHATSAIARAMAGVADRAELESRLNEVFRLHPWDLVR